MSRETDSSSSGPLGRGGAAYPSGTPPYGSHEYPSLHPQQDAPEEPEAVAPRDEPRTETTLTTRIRINIPGSRPIPPVVMRTPMGESDPIDGRGVPGAPKGERTGATPRPEAPREPADGRGPGAADEKPAGSKPPASDWFAPRKPSGPATGAGAGMGAGAAAVSGPPATPEPRPADDGRPETPYYADAPFGTRPPGSGDGPSGPTTGPAPGSSPLGSPSAGGSSLGGAPTSALSALHGTGPDAQDPSGPGRSVPGQSDTGRHGIPGQSGPGQDGPGARGGAGAPRLSDDTAELTPQTPAPEPPGHVSGDTLTSGIPVVPPDHRTPFPGQGTPGGGTPGGRPGTGPQGGGPRPDLTSRPSPLAHGQIPGQSSGPGPDFSSPDFAGLPGTPRVTPSAGPSPVRPAATAPPAKKGRSKRVLLAAAVVVVAGGFYGAGLLMNHSDVPKGSTVLGVDIGGGTRDQAVNKLDSVLGERAATPLRLSIGGKTEELAPENAGLSLDSQATVRDAAGSDYNPVSVIGSLFGQARIVDPVIPVDQEKLSVALTDLAGVSGSASEGTIKFEPNKAVAVPGKVGKALDVGQSMVAVRDAYRAQVQTGKPNTVQLPVTTRQPTISQAELDRAMKEFAEPAMSGLVTIKAGDKQIQFGPALSLPKILSMKAIDGKLVEVYDKKAVTELLDGVFDGITITKGDGQQHPVSTDDVTQALQKALLGKTPAERTQVIALDPS
ncbi:hypothetical protein [Streptomyces sp. NPDC088725]|uniref:hypothetical protein n=1 Tax=Streptomyces sp. NPDC088725 TaxID=3365873 RepID=UPI00382CD6EB